MKLENEKRDKIIYVLLIIFLLIFSIFFYINIKKPVAMKKYEVSFEVAQSIGFDLNNTSLKFGRIFPGSETSKEINVANTYDFPVKVSLSASDNIADIIYMKEELIIDPYKSKSFPIFLYVPRNYSYGNYSGEIVINFLKIRK